MTAQDPDADVRRLSGEALRNGDPTGWFERLADAAQGRRLCRGTAGHLTRCWSSGSSSNRLARCTAPWWWARAGRRCGVPRGARIPRDRLRHLEICDRIGTAPLPDESGGLPGRRSAESAGRVASAFRSCGGDLHHAIPARAAASDRRPPRGPLRRARRQLLVLAVARDGDEPVDGPPWPLSRADIESLQSRVWRW